MVRDDGGHGEVLRCGVVRAVVGKEGVVVGSQGCEGERDMVGDRCVVRPGETQPSTGRVSVHRYGKVEGSQVSDIILDTGCARTMLHQHLVPKENHVLGEAITLRCAHWDTVLYPLADVSIEVSGVKLQVRAAVSRTLPVSLLLGTDVGQLLGEEPKPNPAPAVEEVLVVTRAQARA